MIKNHFGRYNSQNHFSTITTNNDNNSYDEDSQGSCSASWNSLRGQQRRKRDECATDHDNRYGRNLRNKNHNHNNKKTTNSLTNHILQLHRSNKHTLTSSREVGHSSNGQGAALPLELVQRFIVFCRSQCQPVLSMAACGVLKQHYLE